MRKLVLHLRIKGIVIILLLLFFLYPFLTNKVYLTINYV